MDHQINGIALPNDAGFFGNYGGQFIPPHLKAAMDDIKVAYEQIRETEAFQTELAELFAHYVGRPSPLFGGVLKSMLTLNEAIIDVKEG